MDLFFYFISTSFYNARKKEIEKATKHINDKMDEYAEEFYSNKKQKDDDLSL